jgi:hypothetical protein
MSNSVIFACALAVYAVAVFVVAFALLRIRRENERLNERVRDLEARLRRRSDRAQDPSPQGTEADLSDE